MNDKSGNVCYKPGDQVLQSGIYINPQTGEKTTCVEGKPFPPTAGDDQCWQIDIPTKED